MECGSASEKERRTEENEATVGTSRQREQNGGSEEGGQNNFVAVREPRVQVFNSFSMRQCFDGRVFPIRSDIYIYIYKPFGNPNLPGPTFATDHRGLGMGINFNQCMTKPRKKHN